MGHKQTDTKRLQSVLRHPLAGAIAKLAVVLWLVLSALYSVLRFQFRKSHFFAHLAQSGNAPTTTLPPLADSDEIVFTISTD